MSRAPLKEEDLRDAREYSIDLVAEQGRQLGALPSRRAMEAFVDPIIEKVSRDHETTPAPRERQSPRDQEGLTRGPDLVSVDFAKATPSVTVLDPRAVKAKGTETPRMEAFRWVIERISRDPEMASWKQKLTSIALKPLPEGHTATACMPCGGRSVCHTRELAIAVVLEQFMARHGDPIGTVIRRRAYKGRK